MNKKFFTLAAVATMLAACSSNDEIVTQEENLKDTPITILSAGVAELTTTRAIVTSGNTSTLMGDNASLGLYANMDVEEDIDSKYQADHERYNYSSGWVFSANDKDGKQMLYSGTGNFFYKAYSPYSIKTTSASDEDYLYDNGTFSVPTEGDYVGGWTEGTYYGITTVSGSQYDLLWGMSSSEGATVAPALYHALTMLVVNITGTGTEIDEGVTVSDVTINGTVVTGDLNLLAEDYKQVVIAKSGVTSNPITAKQFTDGGDYEALIIPQSVALQIKVTLSNNQVFVSDLTYQEFEPGCQYTIKLQVGQDKVELKDITADNWGAGENKGNLETE